MMSRLQGPRHFRRQRRAGLTLVELTVGIAACSALLAGVVPALRAARTDSLRTGCLTNLGRIGAASLIYSAEDPDDSAIPIGVGDAASQDIYTAAYGFGGRSGWGVSLRFVLEPSDSPFAGGPLFQMGSVHRPLNRILYKDPLPMPPIIHHGRGLDEEGWSFDARLDLGVFHCPADATFSGMHHRGWSVSRLSSYEYYGTSYAANALFTRSAVNWGAWSISPYGRSLAHVPAPDNTIHYLENAARYAIHATNPNLDQSGSCWPTSIGTMTARGWHNTDFLFNSSYMDGSCRTVTIRGYGRPASTPYCAGPFSCTCLAVRTSEWRFDTLPAPILPTTKLGSGWLGTPFMADVVTTNDMWVISN